MDVLVIEEADVEDAQHLLAQVERAADSGASHADRLARFLPD